MEGDLKQSATVPFAGSQQDLVVVATADDGLVTDDDDDDINVSRISVPRAEQFHIAYMYENDTDARTEDLVEMGENYRVPVMSPVEVKGLNGYSPTDTYSEIIVSQRYIKTSKGELYEKHQQDLEVYRGKYRVFPNRKIDRVIYHTTNSKFPPLTTLKSSLAISMKAKTTDSAKRKESAQRNDVSSIISRDEQALMSAYMNSSKSLAKIDMKGIETTVVLSSLRKLLAIDVYLNDEIIDYFMLKCLKWLDGTISKDFDFVYCPTVTWQACIYYPLGNDIADHKQQSLYKIATGYGTQPNLLRKKFLILPVNREQHWYLAIVCRPFPAEQLVNEVLQGIPYDQCTIEQAHKIYQRWLNGDVGDSKHTQKPEILFFDSMTTNMQSKFKNYSSFYESTAKYINRALPLIHQTFWQTNNSNELAMAARNTIPYIGHREVKVPGQRNTVDCGIFCVANALAWLNVTGQHGIAYMDAAEMDFSLLFSYADFKGERIKMFNDIKKDISLDLQHLVDGLRDEYKGSGMPAIKSEPLNYNPLSKPFKDLVILINQRVGFMKLNHEYSS